MAVRNAVKVSHPQATPEECRQALENTFSTAESGPDLYFHFKETSQLQGERLSL